MEILAFAASLVLAALPVVTPNPVSSTNYYSESYNPTPYDSYVQPISYEKSYEYTPSYDTYQKPYEYEQPKYESYQQYEQPKYESYQQYEQPKYESYQQYEQPKYEYEQPKYEQPKYEYEQPKYEQPKYEYEQPKYESYQPKYEQPKYEYEQPKYESYQPKYEQPKYEYEQPKYESYQPKYEQPKYESYQPKYEQPKYESYQPKYEQPKYEAYQPKYEQPKYESYQPKYEQPKYESYQPKYEQPKYESYQPKYEQPKYESYQPKYEQTYKVEYYPEYVHYEAITFREMNESIHCGVIPAVNHELYKNGYGGQQYGYASNNLALTTPTLPFGKFPWNVLITDDYNNVLCEGIVVNYRYVLTISSCVEPHLHQKLRIRYGDWDILNNANEYEVYKNVDSHICKKLPVTCSYPSYGYGYQQQKVEKSTGLTLLKARHQPDFDEYPHVRFVCLPEYYPETYEKPSYEKPAYGYEKPSYEKPAYGYEKPSYEKPAYGYEQPKPYGYEQPKPYGYEQPKPYGYEQPKPYGYEQPKPYEKPSYAPAPYVPPPTYKPTYSYYSECYVSGYYGSPTTKLENHPRPTPYEGYGYQQVYYPQTPAYSNSYSYESYESKIPKITKVKQIKCPYEKPSYGYGEEKKDCEEKMCFVGVHGDACVADYGSPIVCLVPEKESYESDYSYGSYESSYKYQPEQQYSSYGYAPNSYYKKEIKAAPAQDKVERKRAVVVALVEYPAQCSSNYKPQKYSYGYGAQEEQSKPITAIKVTEKVVDQIFEKFFEGAKNYC